MGFGRASRSRCPPVARRDAQFRSCSWVLLLSLVEVLVGCAPVAYGGAQLTVEPFQVDPCVRATAPGHSEEFQGKGFRCGLEDRSSAFFAHSQSPSVGLFGKMDGGISIGKVLSSG